MASCISEPTSERSAVPLVDTVHIFGFGTKLVTFPRAVEVRRAALLRLGAKASLPKPKMVHVCVNRIQSIPKGKCTVGKGSSGRGEMLVCDRASGADQRKSATNEEQ